jgi:hypothetical protein
MMDPTNEHGSQKQSAGSELLLGMHGFVGGQSQNSGRAPGLYPAAGYVSCEGPRRRTTYEALRPRGCDDQGAKWVIDLGLGGEE